ncbi:MAG TPA: WecB/TagA/CpsF family glycosyltransferase [Solirubrobacteraceae bacterium]|jgi:N-acetylglucosaminyldiphosphoundecaprenol N-acetyl-beta-D-mannosaminyltransferase|nr:WecB/TagA/CpsF family glycosyltransferase [Solirubrobacteraceae bacterium]
MPDQLLQRHVPQAAIGQRPAPADPAYERAPRVRIMGVEIAAVTEADAVREIVGAAEARRGHWTITANLDHLRRYRRNPVERALIDQADLVVADGMPLVWASRLAGGSLPERVAGSRMIWSICEAAGARRQSIFLLGGDPGVAERAAAILTRTYPTLPVAGIACPPVGFEQNARELAQIRRQLVRAEPQIVFVALGFPKQDLLIRGLRESLPGTSFVGVGISLSYVTKDVSPAPAWVCRAGMEWAYRLFQEPARLVRRYLVQGLPFALRLMSSSAWHRLARRIRGESAGWGSVEESTSPPSRA